LLPVTKFGKKSTFILCDFYRLICVIGRHFLSAGVSGLTILTQDSTIIMLIQRTERNTKRNSDICIVHEYHFDDKHIGFAVAEISGRYPEANYAINEECQMIYFVINGSAKLTIENQEYDINEGDAAIIPSGKKYCIDGNVTVAISTSPAWFPEQYKETD
jgi:mannose-6-phosphate isomerase-like protein (cupin superfamily)